MLLTTACLSAGHQAHADCDAANQYNFSFNTAPAAQLSYTGSSTYTATNSLGQSISFTVTYLTNGLSTNVVSTATLPAINNLINDSGTTNNNLMIGGRFASRTATITSGVRTITTILTFATAVRDARVQLNDVDWGTNQFRDWIFLSGSSPAGTYVPAITTPFANNNAAGPRDDANSTMTLGSATTPYSISASEAVGTGVANNTGVNNGSLYGSWLQPITSARIIYGNYPLQAGETVTGVQAYGIQSVSFCPMPQISVAKSSVPFSDPANGTVNPKAIPGADVDYTLTVTNTGGSPLDLSGVTIADVLPGTLTLFNGDIDPVTAGTQTFVFTAGTSGLTLSAANLTFSNNGGASYAYTPAAGYDVNVNALRFVPSGAMAANSSFSVRFRARVK